MEKNGKFEKFSNESFFFSIFIVKIKIICLLHQEKITDTYIILPLTEKQLSLGDCCYSFLIIHTFYFQNRTTDTCQENILANIEDQIYIHHHQFISCYLFANFICPPEGWYYVHKRSLTNVLLENFIINLRKYHSNI